MCITRKPSEQATQTDRDGSDSDSYFQMAAFPDEEDSDYDLDDPDFSLQDSTHPVTNNPYI